MNIAWEKGPLEYEGAEITFYQDLPRKILLMRRVLKPILEAAKEKKALYKWGYPFALTIRLNGKSVILKTQAQLPEVFELLDMQKIDIQDWTSVLQEPVFFQ